MLRAGRFDQWAHILGPSYIPDKERNPYYTVSKVLTN